MGRDIIYRDLKPENIVVDMGRDIIYRDMGGEPTRRKREHETMKSNALPIDRSQISIVNVHTLGGAEAKAEHPPFIQRYKKRKNGGEKLLNICKDLGRRDTEIKVSRKTSSC